MKFFVLGERSIKITLDKEDMSKYGVSYESMDYSNTHTKKIIWELLDAAKSKTGFDTQGGKLHIQVYPIGKEGCEMYISKVSSLSDGKTGTVEFSDFENALCAMMCLYRNNELYGSKLYASEDSYYIVSPNAQRISEFGNALNGKLWEAWLGEHAKLIMDSDGIEKNISVFMK